MVQVAKQFSSDCFAVFLSYGIAQQSSLQVICKEQSATHKLEKEAGLSMSTQTHCRLVWLLPQRLQARGLPKAEGKSVKHLSTYCCTSQKGELNSLCVCVRLNYTRSGYCNWHMSPPGLKSVLSRTQTSAPTTVLNQDNKLAQ